MPKVNITLSKEIWGWWKENGWINLSKLAGKELKRLRSLYERDLGICPVCGNDKLKFVDGVVYKCTKCGHKY
ncbi:MAG: hypothetical protein QGH39_07365 [Candidatus Thermoplasmatota archaeon]|jgi:tRNA(Ile2) C34 agmatinyltransferase TiaS|nr:hypothetical protein [Candidatus Thermoplasmatota archaeon]MDP7265364.1 hypothetical protein [Candidatus Thermoplasmatota archaeon]